MGVILLLIVVAIFGLILYRLAEAERAINQLAEEVEEIRDFGVDLHRRLYPNEWNADGTPRT